MWGNSWKCRFLKSAQSYEKCINYLRHPDGIQLVHRVGWLVVIFIAVKSSIRDHYSTDSCVPVVAVIRKIDSRKAYRAFELFSGKGAPMLVFAGK